MKKIGSLGVVIVCLLVFTCSCAATNSTGNPTTTKSTGETIGSSFQPTTTPGPTTTTESPTPAPTQPEPSYAPGSIALFATISGGSQSDFIRVEGGNVSWDTTHYKFLRYIPNAQLLDEFGWTSSKSYSKSYIYGITAGNWVYVVKCFTDSGRKDITRLDPATGNQVGAFGTFTTTDMYRGFTIHDDMVIYRTKVNKDLFGNRTSGGNVMAMRLGEYNAEEILDYHDNNNAGRYYSIGDSLITIVTTYENDARFYDIYRVNPATFTIGELLYSFGTEENIEFFEGTTSLFWTETDPNTGNINIVRFPLDEHPVYYLEISESIPTNLSIDESGGKVLVSFRDNTPESPFYYLADIATGDITELDIDPAFFSKSIYGNGQFLILD